MYDLEYIDKLGLRLCKKRWSWKLFSITLYNIITGAWTFSLWMYSEWLPWIYAMLVPVSHHLTFNQELCSRSDHTHVVIRFAGIPAGILCSHIVDLERLVRVHKIPSNTDTRPTVLTFTRFKPTFLIAANFVFNQVCKYLRKFSK